MRKYTLNQPLWLRNIYKQCSELIVAKNKLLRHLPLMLASLAMGLGVFINVNTPKQAELVQAAIDYSACETAHNANNKSNLKTALYNVVKNGSPGSYSDLWTSYLTVYKKSNGYLKDYYSNTSTFTSANQDNGSGGTTEGDKYNREHTIPKSWWGGSTSNQGADIFIVVPADKLVNNKRSDNCLGVVGSATFTSNNNYSKLGTSSSAWNFFGSPVFEPNDEVKGDLARIVFYSIIKYDVSSWTTGNGSYVFSGNTSASSNFGLTANAIKLFSYWNNLDKPDDWERTVNTRGNSVQGNPNPFIDHPEYANTLWGDVSGYTTYSTSSASLSISPSSGSISVGGTLNLTATASGGSGNVTWSITSGNSYVSLNTTSGNSVTVTGLAAGSATVTASYSGVSSSCVITVNSASKTLSSISVSTAPTKTTYTAGEYFNPSGLVIKRTYSDSTYDTYTYANHTSEFSFSPSTSTALTTSNTFVTITYGGKSCSQAIVVNASGGGGDTESFSTTYSYSDMTNWSVSNTGSASGYVLCPDASSDYSVALIPGIFSNKTITSNVVITINSATYGSGNNPTPSTYAVYNSNSCSTLVNSSQSGTLPSSTTYTDVIYTISLANTSTFSDDLAIKITKPGKQIRLKSIKVEFSYETSGAAPAITSITASVSKTFYVGETISTSDITVKDNNNKNVTSFSFTSYQFKYSDATSGGSSTLKTFTNGVSYESLSCDLTVQVQRKACVTPIYSSLEHTGSEFGSGGISASSYSENLTATVDGIGFKVNGYIYNSKLSLSDSKTSANGSVVNTTPYPAGITNVSVSGASPDIQLSVDGSNWVDLSSASISTIDYWYLKIYYKTTAQSNYVNISSITVTIKGYKNVANYIMYEDTNNQCTSKLGTALGYFKNLSSSDKSTFETSSDYVISTARTRLEAWARSQGKSIDYSTGNLNNISNIRTIGSLLGEQGNNSAIIMIIIVSTLGISAAGLCLYMRKRKQDR